MKKREFKKLLIDELSEVCDNHGLIVSEIQQKPTGYKIIFKYPPTKQNERFLYDAMREVLERRKFNVVSINRRDVVIHIQVEFPSRETLKGLLDGMDEL